MPRLSKPRCARCGKGLHARDAARPVRHVTHAVLHARRWRAAHATCLMQTGKSCTAPRRCRCSQVCGEQH